MLLQWLTTILLPTRKFMGDQTPYCKMDRDHWQQLIDITSEAMTKGGMIQQEQHRRSHNSQSAPVCHYCKHRGHVMSEFWVPEKKENKHKAALVVKKAESVSYHSNRKVSS